MEDDDAGEALLDHLHSRVRHLRVVEVQQGEGREAGVRGRQRRRPCVPNLYLAA